MIKTTCLEGFQNNVAQPSSMEIFIGASGAAGLQGGFEQVVDSPVVVFYLSNTLILPEAESSPDLFLRTMV